MTPASPDPLHAWYHAFAARRWDILAFTWDAATRAPTEIVWHVAGVDARLNVDWTLSPCSRRAALRVDDHVDEYRVLTGLGRAAWVRVIDSYASPATARTGGRLSTPRSVAYVVLAIDAVINSRLRARSGYPL